MLVSRDEERKDEHSAGDDPERVYCTLGRWSPRALVHTVPQRMSGVESLLGRSQLRW